MENNIAFQTGLLKCLIVGNLSRALREIAQAQSLMGTILPTNDLTVNRRLSAAKYDLATCMDQVLTELHKEARR